ncbi:hypothetical protein QQS21_007809 [Conoideocrella luteorostrata]|uniref:WSC domain-containing protein n=1 Tax=Conoideocrella luteorostrata TaxID=1105319 RepID=A0AAJ0FX22_9HYPO|nr:hypothetical protein QQS21_007809 [Conoideocrella luteorostrata]
MSRAALIAGLMAASVAAQANLASEGFQYIGCVEASPGIFPVNMELGDGFTVGQCQEACGKSGANAAAAGNGCHCNSSISQAAVDFDVVDESRCSQPCSEADVKAGQCGGPVASDGKQLYNLYQRIPTDPTPAGYDATMPPANNKVVDAPSTTTSILLQTIISCAPGVLDCPAQNQTALPTLILPSQSCAEEHLPPPPPVETKFEEPCPESSIAVPPPPPPPATTPCACEEAVAPKHHHKTKGCPGPECMQNATSIALPPSSEPPAETSGPVVISDGSVRSVSAVMAALSLGALVLAFGMS